MPNNDPVNRISVAPLELRLAAREDTCNLFRIQSLSNLHNRGRPLCAHAGAIVNSRNFRKFLLEVAGDPGDDLPTMQLTQFLLPDLGFEQPARFNDQLYMLSLLAWSKYSRRVFGLTPSIQAIAEATSLDGLTWNRVKMPFGAFAIQLAMPIPGPKGEQFDFVVVSNLPSGVLGQAPYLLLSAYSSRIRQYQPMVRGELARLEAQVRGPRWRNAETRIKTDLLPRASDSGEVWTLFMNQGAVQDLPVLQTAEQSYRGSPDLPPEYQPLMDELVRIVVGLCLYLRALPRNSRYVTPAECEPLPRANLPDRQRITQEADVCTVASCYQLTHEDEVELGLVEGGNPRRRARQAPRWRWVMGYDRRPPGQGRNPDALRSVSVRAYLTRIDLATTPGATGGTMQMLV